MAYFSRLTDIVSCNLSSLMARNDNCASFLQNIIGEMREGVAGAQRCVTTAMTNVSRLESEIGEQRIAVKDWMSRAESALRKNEENQARLALERKHEVEDLIAGLEQQLQAAISTRDHLHTMLNALQARLADGLRRLEEMKSGHAPQEPEQVIQVAALASTRDLRQNRVDSELAELRRQISSD